MEKIDFKDLKVFGEGPFRIIFGEYKEVKEIIDNYHEDIYYYEIESDRRNSCYSTAKNKKNSMPGLNQELLFVIK